MASRSSSLAAALLCLAIPSASPAADGATADEPALQTLWDTHRQECGRSNYAAAAAAAEEFAARLPRSDLLPVSRGLAAWSLLKAGRPGAARDALAALAAAPAEAGPLAQAGQDMARRWLTRLDREAVREALRAYYATHVRFPEFLDSLGKLKGCEKTPLADRWNKPWRYRLTAFDRVRGLTAQRYSLDSPSLGEASDLTAALARPYAGGITLEPLEVSADGSRPTVTVAVAGGGKAVLMEGTATDGVTLAYVGARLLVFTDGDHWRVVPRPGG